MQSILIRRIPASSTVKGGSHEARSGAGAAGGAAAGEAAAGGHSSSGGARDPAAIVTGTSCAGVPLQPSDARAAAETRQSRLKLAKIVDPFWIAKRLERAAHRASGN